MKVYRTLVIRYPLKKLKEEEREAVLRLLPRLDALGNLYARGYEVAPPDVYKQFIYEFGYFKDELKFGTEPKRWFCKVHPIANIQIRTGNEHDKGKCVLVDLPKKQLRLRGFIPRKAIVIQLKDSEAKYIKERFEEGAKAKCARIWIEKDKLCIGIIFEHEVEVRQNYDVLLVIDVNSWRYGVTYAVITPGTEKLEIMCRRPDIEYLERLYNQIPALESKLGRLKRLGYKGTLEYYKIKRHAKSCKSKIYRYLKDFVNKLVHELIELALKTNAKIIVDYVPEEARRELLEEKLDSGLAKIYLLYLQRFVNLLENQAKWYGIPIEFRHLPSTKCPRCGSKLREIEPRVMYCEKCGFEANRDEIPIYHVLLNGIRFSKNKEADVE